MDEQGNPVLYALVTGAGAARDIDKLVDLALGDGWQVCVIASPDGCKFIDADALATKTGYPVRSQYKAPGTPDPCPPADAMIVAPITSNSLAKWAAGISDTLPLGLLVEAVGKGMPVVAVPFVNRALFEFPAIQDAVRKLAEWGVIIIGGTDVGEPHEPGTGEAHIPHFPWHRAWQTVLTHPHLTPPS
ncbi:flavoprotein [Nocardia sp. NBC_01499]|uniref:flavoprotein n=1 Tax=Nocardia sp. NBC_01499 TaxID=2903597 RepID=UPI00386FBBA2